GLQCLRDTSLDGFGRFIGERKCDEAFRRFAFGEQPGYSIGKRSRLPRTGTRQTKEMAGPIACGVSLRIGQLRPQDFFYAHYRPPTSNGRSGVMQFCAMPLREPPQKSGAKRCRSAWLEPPYRRCVKSGIFLGTLVVARLHAM